MALFPVGLNKILRVYNNKIISQMSIATCNPKRGAVGYKLSPPAPCRAEEGEQPLQELCKALEERDAARPSGICSLSDKEAGMLDPILSGRGVSNSRRGLSASHQNADSVSSQWEGREQKLQGCAQSCPQLQVGSTLFYCSPKHGHPHFNLWCRTQLLSI